MKNLAFGVNIVSPSLGSPTTDPLSGGGGGGAIRPGLLLLFGLTRASLGRVRNADGGRSGGGGSSRIADAQRVSSSELASI
jgi:hypothetical protein